MSTEKNQQGVLLLRIARAAISRALQVPCAQPQVADNESWLYKPGATFVTLTQSNELRGCIGSLQAYCPLIEDVRNNAVSAALRDPRFMPLTAIKLSDVAIEVSLLSELKSLNFSCEGDALAQLRPGIDGVVFEYGHHRSTFLPQVWESLPQSRQFLAKLKLKAKLPESFWSEGIILSRYTVSKWRETDLTEEYTHG